MKAEAKTKLNSNTLTIHGKAGDDPAAAIAQTYLRPTVQAACTVRAFNQNKEGGGPDLAALVVELGKQVEAANRGDLSRPEAMLIAQAHSLDAIFGSLARRAAVQEYLTQYEVYFRLALKAQSQCRATLETLALIKNPPNLAFVKQANIAHGPQQVNNVPEGSRARQLETKQGKLLGDQHGERLDTTTQSTTGSPDSQLEAVGAVNGTANG